MSSLSAQNITFSHRLGRKRPLRRRRQPGWSGEDFPARSGI